MSVYKKQRKDGTTAWYFDFMHNGVRYRGVGGTTKSQAIRALDKKRTEVLNDEHGLKKSVNNPRIEDYAETYLARRKHLRFHKRDALSVKNLLKFFKGQRLMEITPAKIEDYIRSRLEDGVANGTINRELTCLKRMFTLANKWKEASINPVKDVVFLEEPPGRTRFLSETEAANLIMFASDHLKPIIITALNTGMRLSEILSLKWQQVHFESAVYPHIELLVTKNNKIRHIPLNTDMVSLLQRIKDVNDKRSQPSEHVFLGKYGKPLLSVKGPFKSALKKAGISNFRFHDLRHTFASHYVMNGGDLMSLKEIGGWSSMKMVERYSHLASDYKAEMMNKLSGKFTDCHPIATSPKTVRITNKKEAS